MDKGLLLEGILMIILENIYDERSGRLAGFVFIEESDFENPLGISRDKDLMTLIREDIASNKDDSGWAKYRDILEAHNKITKADKDKWTVKPSVGIPP